MRIGVSLPASLAVLVIVAGGVARADYYSNPELRPETRCAGIPPGIGDPSDLGGDKSLHCQRLFWDLPVTTQLPTIAVSAPYAGDIVPRFPRGITDRIPPMWVGTLKAVSPPLSLPAGKAVGEVEGFEYETDCNNYADNCQRLCSDTLDIPYWQEQLNGDGSPMTGTDGSGRLGVDANGNPTTAPQTGPLFKLACTRGSRSYYGPWQTGGTVNAADCLAEPDHGTNAVAGKCQGPVFDRLAATQAIRFENTARLNDDALNGRLVDGKRLEWNVGTEFYNHFASHHGTCSQATDPCADAKNPPPASAFDDNPSATCYNYKKASSPGGSCYAGDSDPRCNPPDKIGMGGFRNATQLPGRLSVPIPGGRGAIGTEDDTWGCNHHVVTQLPPGSYSMSRLANYRLQTGGITNNTNDTIFGVAPGKVYGGAVGEMIIQYFTKPANDPNVKPVNVMFNALADAATTYYPPFSWNYHESEWTPPFDSELGLLTIHSHHRMVKGYMNVFPANSPRPNDTDPTCGGPKADGTPGDLYTDWFWEDAPVCQYWKEKDGPVPLRKGESLRTTCYVNNGITPEAIKHGLVAGASVQALKALGAPIPDYPMLGPASTWGDTLANSAAGKELLYGTHPPINYRVVYKCSAVASSVPGATLLTGPEGIGYSICSPNPAKDADGDYIDGAYQNDLQCGPGGLCQPGSIVFACIGEDEMCIGVSMYWAMPRILNADGSPNQEATNNLQNGNVNNVGTPGNVGTETDVSGICTECDEGPLPASAPVHPGL